MVYLYNKQPFLTLDTSKLLFLSLSITLPIVMVNCTIDIINLKSKNNLSIIDVMKDPDLVVYCITTGTIYSYAPTYAVILVKLFFPQTSPKESFLYILISMLINFLFFYPSKKTTNQASKPSTNQPE